MTHVVKPTFTDIGSAFRAVAELHGRTLSEPAALLLASSLAEYTPEEILQALNACMRELNRFPTIADIVSRIESKDGRPGAEQAWALIPKDEHSSAAITNEMQEAYGVAHEHLKNGDHVAGRMAFKEVYEKLVRENRITGKKPTWVASLGYEKTQRDTAIAECDRKNGTELKALPNLSAKQVEELPPVDPDAGKKIKALLEQITKPMPDDEIERPK